MTNDNRQRLRIDLGDFEGQTAYVEYDNFKVASASDKYRLVSLGKYTGTAGKRQILLLLFITLHCFSIKGKGFHYYFHLI